MSAQEEQLRKFENLLAASLDATNPERAKAEEILIKRRQDATAQSCQGFMLLILHSKKDFNREFAAVLLRQHFDVSDEIFWVYPKLSEAARSQIKQGLLQAIANPRLDSLRHLICDRAASES